jgi:hypothetical protein
VPGSPDDRGVLPPPPANTVSILPALVVLVIAVVTLGIFGLINLVDTSSTSIGTPVDVVGGLPVDAHPTVFTGWVADGTPPANIATGMLVPVGTTYLAGVPVGGGGAGGFDREVRLSINAPRAQLLGFYHAELQAGGWNQFSSGHAQAGGDELLFLKAGSDGWYWEIGVVATSSGPVSSPTTRFTYRLYQASDEN